MFIGRASRVAVVRLALALFFAALLLGGVVCLLGLDVVRAQGNLTVEIAAAYNLVVDSNAESPSTYAPSVATVMGRFCNTGDETITNVWGYIGDYGNNTPGTYPSRLSTDADFISQHPALEDSGSYAFTHVGGRRGTADAERYVGSLAPGECKVQYWHFKYPQCSNSEDPPCSGVPVWGDSVKPDDDLWLTFDIWATAHGGFSASATRKMTMRNEISAMANKIEPNGNPGGAWFNTESDYIRPGEVITSNGIRYEFGNVRHGFDNDGDFAPDFNAWAQPIGDPSFDPSCFRLIHTYGILTVTRSAGKPDMVMTFEDQLYFMNLPPDNTGVTGNIHYTFLALDGPCETTLSPYQEVASGYDNEKFNGDYGVAIPPVGSNEPEVTVDKSGNITVTPGSEIDYSLYFSNTGDSAAGMPLVSMPLVFSDAIPSGTSLVTDSTDASLGVNILYSTDNGQTWTATVPASGVTHIQWWLSDTLAGGADGTITFSVRVDPATTAAFVENCADAQYDSGSPFAEACFTTLISGDNRIGDWVWKDMDSDGEQDAGEVGINGITVWLYWDSNGNGVLDDVDRLLVTDTTATSGTTGYYLFENLPNGNFIVQVDDDDPQLPTGYRNTTPITHAVTPLTSTNSPYLNADFGFGPALDVLKSIVGGGGYEGREIYYNLAVRNLMPGQGEAVGDDCRYNLWAITATTGANPKDFDSPDNAAGAGGPDGAYASGDFKTGANKWIDGSGYDVDQQGTINKVEAVFQVYVNPALTNDFATVKVVSSTLGPTSPIAESTFSTADFNGFVGAQHAGLLIWDVTASGPGGSWDWGDFASHSLYLEEEKAGQGDASILYIDAIGFRVTTDEPCAAVNPDHVISTVPLTDSFDANRLQFVSASPPASSINATTGVISWTNVGPLYPGETKVINVIFHALELTPSAQISNTVCATGASFSDGKLTNNDCATETGTISVTGSISGVVWSDTDSLGWEGTVGYDGDDYRIPNVEVALYVCEWDDGSGFVFPAPKSGQPCSGQSKPGNISGQWTPIYTETTDANGHFLFEGLLDAYYYVKVGTSSLPGSATQTAEALPNGTGDTCGTISCDNQWGGPENQDLDDPVYFEPVDNAKDITEVNFGYAISATIYGTVWHDHDGDGNRDDGDNGLDNGTQGVTVTLTASDGTTTTTQTDANGYYEFTGLAAGTYTVTVATATLPAGGTWTQTAETGPNQDGTLDSLMTTVPLVGGQVSGSYDFGYTQSGDYSIGDTVYYDWDGDATQDAATEEGIPGVTVSLYEDSDGDGTVDAGVDALVITTTASITGYYKFDDLPAGSYIVVVDRTDPDLPSSYLQTQDPDEDPGVCTDCDSQGSATVSSTLMSDLTVDFGYYSPNASGAIGDTVWRDMDGDGVQSGVLETGIVSITVWLEVDLNDDGVYTRVATQTTDADGKYLFENLPDAKYRVVVGDDDADLPTDAFRYTYIPSTATAITTTISGGNTYLDADFGFMPLGAIGDTIYWDANRNGDLDRGEGGISGIVITLTNLSVITTSDGITYPTGSYVLTTTTNVTGVYLFTGLASGTYSVTVGVITNTPTLIGDPDTNGTPCTDPALDPFFEPFCDGQTNKNIPPGTVFLGADFGYDPPGVIGDYVWRDLDNDGVQDGNEPGIAGVVVTVTNNGTTHTTTTDFDGYYSFSNLDDGDWTVTFQQPANMTPTVTSVNAITSGVGSVGLTTTVVINTSGDVTSIEGASCTTCSLYIDSGFVLSGALYISGTVFYDSGGTGDGTTGTDDKFTTGDTPYANITVYLYDASRKLIGTTTTDASGQYTFTNLISGIYTVSVNANAPQLDGLDLTAVNTYELQTYHTVNLSTDPVTDVDFGFYEAMDFGDLPAAYNVTKLEDEGAYHIIGALYLGTDVQAESDGVESVPADGDGLEEDGVERHPGDLWQPTQQVNLTVTVTGNGGYLVGWFNWNGWSGGDTDFNDAGERIVFGNMPAGANVVTVTVPGAYQTGEALYVRFRLYDGQPSTMAATGSAENGEVEDYYWTFDANVVAVRNLAARSPLRVGSVALAVILMLVALGGGVLVLRRRARSRA